MANNASMVPKKAAVNRATAKADGPRKAVSNSSYTATASEKIAKLVADLGDWRGEWLAEIRRLIHEADPEVVEDWKWKVTPVWSHEGMYVNANAFKDKVKLTFHHGAQLSDPANLFNNGLDGNKWRAIDIREGDSIDEAALKALLREAVAYNTEHSVPKSKGSRDV